MPFRIFLFSAIKQLFAGFFFFQAEDGIRDVAVTGVRRVLFRSSRPDISQRYERWGWPATIIFGADGTEIVKLRGFYSPKFFIPVLQETIRDPSPVDYGKPGPERERTLATGLSDAERTEILGLLDKAYDRDNGGWS